jgi:hypothetical protein
MQQSQGTDWQQNSMESLPVHVRSFSESLEKLRTSPIQRKMPLKCVGTASIS